mgnify:CR=1 FL=1
MANYKDNNADLGNQTIEGTQPPIVLDAVIVMPDGSTEPIIPADAPNDPPSAADLDAQLAAMLDGDAQAEQQNGSDDLDAQLAALMAEQQNDAPQPEPAPSDQPSAADLDAQLAAMLDGEPAETPDRKESDLSEIDAQFDAILSEPSPPDPPQDPEPIPEDEPVIIQPAQEQQADTPAQDAEQPETAIVTPPAQEIVTEQRPPETSVQTDEARAMMEQAQQIMEQARQAQAQAAAQMQAAHIQSQVTQAVRSAQAAPPPQPAAQSETAAEAEAARAMMRQAQMMLQQAQEAQLQAQRAAQEAQLQAQAASAARAANPSPMPITDPYAIKEVDRLKNELDGMRDLVNKLTFSIAQGPNGAQQNNMQAPPPNYGYNADREQYRKLETELDRMRREIIEKDLRDREKELDRRQKEAENTVKDIRPEMVQMSESRDVAPVGGQGSAFGGEFIPLANGVFYSIKDKQVYVMTPASNAAAASPTIEPPSRPTVKKKPVARAKATPKRRPLSAHAHRRGAPPRRRPTGGRPTHR